MTDAKAALRCQLRQQVAELTPAMRQESDRLLLAQFLALPQVVAAETLLLFCGMGGEPDTRPLLSALWHQGKRVLLPQVLPQGGMQARYVTQRCPLLRHPYGMLEPGEACPPAPPPAAALILVPALCYDGDGYRLGQGGGYYDRYLPQTTGVTVGLCREALLQQQVPRQGHDWAVDWVLTEHRVLGPFGRRSTTGGTPTGSPARFA